MSPTKEAKNGRAAALSLLLILLSLAAVAGAVQLSSIPSAHAETLNPWTPTTSYPDAQTLSCVTSGGYVYCVSISGSGVYYAPISSSGVGAWSATTNYPVDTTNYPVDTTNWQSCAGYGGYIYCVAGINETEGPRPTTAVYYAPLSSSGVGPWAVTSDYPVGEIALSCAAFDAYIYCVGGDETVGTLESDNVYYAPLSSSGVGEWSSATDYPITVAEESCTASQGFIYCVGGYTANGPRSVSATYYAPISSSGVGPWTAVTPYPSLSDSLGYTELSCLTLSAYIYCVGGDSTSVYYAELPSSGGIGSWTSTASYPVKAESPGCVALTATITCAAGSTDGVYYSSSDSLPLQSQLTVTSQDASGDALPGFYTTLSQNGSVISTGFTPATFTLNDSQTYAVTVGNYGRYAFSHWLDTGSTDSTRAVSITQDSTITAVYAPVQDSTKTSVTCHAGLLGAVTCTATVSDTASDPLTPTGSVDFKGSSVTGRSSVANCTLSSASNSKATCTVQFSPVAVGPLKVTASYGGDAFHLPSRGSETLACVLLSCTRGLA
jgi:hypothetical protein